MPRYVLDHDFFINYPDQNGNRMSRPRGSKETNTTPRAIALPSISRHEFLFIIEINRVVNYNECLNDARYVNIACSNGQIKIELP